MLLPLQQNNNKIYDLLAGSLLFLLNLGLAIFLIDALTLLILKSYYYQEVASPLIRNYMTHLLSIDYYYQIIVRRDGKSAWPT